MLNHVTYEVSDGVMQRRDLEFFMNKLGFFRVPVEEDVPDGWKVEWYKNGIGTTLHFVEVPVHDRAIPGSSPYLGAGHFCVDVDIGSYEYIRMNQKSWIERDSGSGRLWLSWLGLRVEVRVQGAIVTATREGFAKPDPHRFYTEPLPGADLAKKLGDHLLSPFNPFPADEEKSGRPCPPIIPGPERIKLVGKQDICGEISESCDYLPGHIGRHSWEVEAIDEELSDLITENFQRRDVEPKHWKYALVLEKAFDIYKQRYEVYQGDSNWQREGMKGALFNLRRKVERAWDNLWNRNAINLSCTEGDEEAEESLDDLYDVINYAVFAIMSANEGREGDWFE